MEIKALIIEDQPGVAVAIEQQLQHVGKFAVDRCVTVQTALERISAARKVPYDLILCDYNLGEATNGQQLLEYLRGEGRIPRHTAFIMLTAEAGYGSVASAVELGPDAYLLKPFTVGGLEQRVNYALAKHQALLPVYARLDGGEPDWAAAVGECNRIVAAGSRFALEALHLKTDCLLRNGQYGEAACVFDKVIAWRPTPWAEVGRARALRLMGEVELAERKLAETLRQFPQYVVAYDELSAIIETYGDSKRAQEILESAHRVVPSNRRTRQIGLLALENGDLKKAAAFLKVVTERDRYGLKRSTEDFFSLATALRRMERYDEAMAVVDSLGDHFPASRPLSVRKMASEALTLVAAKRPFDARKRLQDALELRQDSTEPRTQLELAEACFCCGDAATAAEIFAHVGSNWQESPAVVKLAKTVMARAGCAPESIAELDTAMQQLAQTNNEAVGDISQGHFPAAIAKLEAVAKRLPNHSNVQANYALALLLWVGHEAPPKLMELPHHSKPRVYIAQAREHLRQLCRINPGHPRLPELQRLLAQLTGETGVAAAVVPPTEELACMEVGV